MNFVDAANLSRLQGAEKRAPTSQRGPPPTAPVPAKAKKERMTCVMRS